MSKSAPDDDGPSEGYQAVIPFEEARLVAAAKAGDSNALTALVEATQADVYTLAYRIVGNEDDARDVVQEAYLRAFRSLRRFRGDARFSTWMFRITANCAATHLTGRSKFRHEELGDDDNVLDERPESDPEAMAEAGALRDKVTAALASLPPKLRAVVVLRDVYDLPHDVIASELGITESAAKVRLHRARRKLRERLFPVPQVDHPTYDHQAAMEKPTLPEVIQMRQRGLTFRQIGDILSVSAGAAQKRHKRAEELLAPENGSHEPTAMEG